MKLIVRNIRHRITEKPCFRDRVARRLGVRPAQVGLVKVVHKTVDARGKAPSLVYRLEVDLNIAERKKGALVSKRGVFLSPPKGPSRYRSSRWRNRARPIVVGAGPAGLFASLALLKRGLSPVVLERGGDIEERAEDVAVFWRTGRINPESNVQFGEGGAGAFSDGKLVTRIRDPRKEEVFREFVEAGAPEEVMVKAKPHLGTDRIQGLVKRIRQKLLEQGAEIHFNVRARDIVIEKGRVVGVETPHRSFESPVVFLATGHSARDVFASLKDKGVALAPKPFAVGFRIEHAQNMIDRAQHGKWAGHPQLGAAEYFLTFRDTESGRGVYTFCMCPGGIVIAGSSEEGCVVTNGMSNSLRDGSQCNAAIVVTVGPDDFQGGDPLKGVHFQETLERRAFALGGGDYWAPAQHAVEFLGRGKPRREPVSSYLPGVRRADLRDLLPKPLLDPLRRALARFEEKIRGFTDGAVLVGVESRTSCPVRILRNEKTWHSVNTVGLIPIGEGSGYAGGIISSAVDGIRGAERFDSC
jgi:uncharacterized FAD-dependent dehydrogenase